MKSYHIVLLLFALSSCNSVEIEIEGLSTDGETNNNQKRKDRDDENYHQQQPGENDRKSSKWVEEMLANNDDETPADFDLEELNLDDFPKIEVILAEDFASAIKIVKAPDLSKEHDNKKVTDMFNEIVKNREKMMKNYESELEELQKLESQLELEEKEIETREKTPEEIEADTLYELALSVLNKTRSDKVAGHAAMLKAAEKGHELARLHVAWNQLIGHPEELDFDAARKTFVELVEKGIPEAHMGMGFMFATGIGMNVSQAKALVHYTMAALGGNSWAQMILGYRYWSGVTVASNCEQALGFYKKVASKVAAEVTFSGGAAVHRIRLLDEVENSGPSSGILDNDLIEYYQMLADKGDVQAQVGLGQLYYQGGRGIPLDHQKALQYFTQAANSENGVAMAFLGKIYLEGSENVKADNDTAFKFFKKSADLGNPVGQSGLGIMYLQGKGVPKVDTTKALKYFTQAAEQGWVDGQLQLGNMYFGGIGVKRDFKQANKYFNLASQSGHVLAFYNLAQMHADGLGMIRSCPTAVEVGFLAFLD
jgi:SEL1 protein